MVVTRVFFALLKFQAILNEMNVGEGSTSTAEWMAMLAGGHRGYQQSHRVLGQGDARGQAIGPQ